LQDVKLHRLLYDELVNEVQIVSELQSNKAALAALRRRMQSETPGAGKKVKRCDNVLQFHGLIVGRQRKGAHGYERPLKLLLEYCSRGGLNHVLEEARCGELDLPWGMRLRMAEGVARGVQHMHRCGIVHCDLKSGNVMVDENFNCKVGENELQLRVL
jgi:serine/threonine protein kinase